MADSPSSAAVSAILKLGEERMAALLTQLLANESFVASLQSALAGAVAAKGTLDASLVRVFSALNIPTVEDVKLMQQKLDELEESMADLSALVEKLDALTSGPTPPQAPRKKARARRAR